jgi:glycerol-3-phosphate dehydrogenase
MDRVAMARALAAELRLPEDVAAHLLHAYGDGVRAVLDGANGDATLLERLHPALPFLRIEAVHAVRHEGARSLEDVLCRRIPAAYLVRDGARSIAQDVAGLIGPELGWTVQDRAEDVRRQAADADVRMACVRPAASPA